MIELPSHLINLGIFMLVLIADRCLVRTRRVRLSEIPLGDVIEENGQYLFPLGYKIERHKHDAVVRYQLHDKNRPAYVIQGKGRPLAMTLRGYQEEFLAINKSQIKHSGEWILNVRVIHGRALLNWNPLYRFFPFIDIATRTYTLEVSNGDSNAA
ncbi:hypothetical protein P8H80_004362 [Escherichia coli]|nr:hypothetical protein [Escherichia coli]